MATLRQSETNTCRTKPAKGPSAAATQPMTEEEKGEFAKAWDEWRPYYDIPRPDHEIALHRLVLASIRLKTCHVEQEKARRTDIERATTRWDEDRRAKADAMGRQLARHPESVSKRLQHTKQGVEWLIERWGTLAARLKEQGEWTEAQVRMVHDLCGLHPALRPVDPNFVNPTRMVAREIERLEGLKAKSLDRLDALDREDAMHGSPSELSPRMARLRRYERALQRELDTQMAFLHKERTWPPNERADRWTCPGCGKVPAPVYEPLPESEPEPAPAPEPEAISETQRLQDAAEQERRDDGPARCEPAMTIEPPLPPIVVPSWIPEDAARLMDGSRGLDASPEGPAPWFDPAGLV